MAAYSNVAYFRTQDLEGLGYTDTCVCIFFVRLFQLMVFETKTSVLCTTQREVISKHELAK